MCVCVWPPPPPLHRCSRGEGGAVGVGQWKLGTNLGQVVVREKKKRKRNLLTDNEKLSSKKKKGGKGAQIERRL